MASAPNKDVEDIPIRKRGIIMNREDPREGEGVFVDLVSRRAAEQVTLNGLTWNDKHMGIVEYEDSTRKYPKADNRAQGNRSTIEGILGGNKLVNYPAWPRPVRMGNNSGE